MYKACKNQKDRIKANLVSYKATLIMRKIIQKSKMTDLKKNAAKVIKIQIKYLNRNWRKTNMKVVSIPFNFVTLKGNDDWMIYENSPEDIA